MLEELLQSRGGSAAKDKTHSGAPGAAEARCGPALITLGDRDVTASRGSVDRYGEGAVLSMYTACTSIYKYQNLD